MNGPSPRRSRAPLLAWFDPRRRDPGGLAFVLNRVSAIGLTIYLFLHLGVLSQLARGPEAYDAFVALARSPLMLTGELLVVAGGLFHGLNGLRIALTSAGLAVRHERRLFYGVLAVAALGTLVFAWRMFAEVLP